MINPVSEWNLTPEKMANYKPGMYLGPPDRVYQPESLVQKGSIQPIVSENSHRFKEVRRHTGRAKKFKVSFEGYIQLRKSGLSRDEIAEQHNLTLSGLRYYLNDWGIGKKELEEAAMKKDAELAK